MSRLYLGSLLSSLTSILEGRRKGYGSNLNLEHFIALGDIN